MQNESVPVTSRNPTDFVPVPPTQSHWITYSVLAVLSIALVAGVYRAMRVWQDLKGGGEPTTDDPETLLAPLAEAYASGQLSEEEFHKVRDSLSPRPAPTAVSSLIGRSAPSPTTTTDPVPELDRARPTDAGPVEPTP